MNIILIGFKNCGKTSVGKLIAEKTNKQFIDTDSLIEHRHYTDTNTLLTSREIYQHKGELYFRDLEKSIITSLSHIDNSIIATGGGCILDSDNISHLKKQGKLIYLNVIFETLLSRLQSQPLPAFLDDKQPEKSFLEVYNQRKNLYKQVADKEILIENKSTNKIAEEIILLMGN